MSGNDWFLVIGGVVAGLMFVGDLVLVHCEEEQERPDPDDLADEIEWLETELGIPLSPREPRKPELLCRGVNSNICVAEGCYGEACRSQYVEPPQHTIVQRGRKFYIHCACGWGSEAVSSEIAIAYANQHRANHLNRSGRN